MGCGTAVVKYSVFFFNLIFVLAGIAFIAVGVIIKLGVKDFAEALGDFGTYIDIVPITIIVIGCIIFVIAFLGCCGAIRESMCMLSTYGVVMLVLFLLQIGIGTFAQITYKNASDNLHSDISTWIKKAINNYGNDHVTKGIDKVQQQFECCGAQGPLDWTDNGKPLPNSCCPDNDCSGSNTFKKGCVSLVFDQVDNIVDIILIIVFTIAAVELAAAIVAFCLTSCIRNNIRRGYY